MAVTYALITLSQHRSRGENLRGVGGKPPEPEQPPYVLPEAPERLDCARPVACINGSHRGLDARLEWPEPAPGSLRSPSTDT
jgi:hypothetical protein